MDAETTALVRELKDRQEIYDCLMRYCRGIDRLDRDMLLSAYHPDAVDDHGVYVGGVEGFATHVFALHFGMQHYTQLHYSPQEAQVQEEPLSILALAV